MKGRSLSIRSRFALNLVILIVLSGSLQAREKITIAVAANVQPAMQLLVRDMEKELDVDIEIIQGASGKLATQIREGAPYDIFASADMTFPTELFHSGLALAAPKPYATGILVLWTTRELTLDNTDLGVLSDPKVRRIALANPKTAPYGAAATEAMNYYHVYNKVKDKLVQGESIGQAEQFVETGNADIGFVAKSQVLSDAIKGKGKWREVDPKAYEPIVQGAVLLKHSKEHGAKAEACFNFLYSETAQKVFRELGYLVN